MKKLLAALVCALTLSVTTGCYSMHHTVGNGAQGQGEVSKRQWYILWGLVPLTDTDSQELAGDAADYTVTTEQSFVDVIINLFTSWLSFVSFDMTVAK